MIDYDALRVAMVDRQVRPADVTDPAIVAAMLAVPRERFAPRASRPVAYADAALPVAPGRVMLEPRTLAKMLDALQLKKTDLVMVVGAATGYAAVVAAHMAAAVVAVEQDPAMAEQAAQRAAELGVDALMVETAPLAEGAPGSGPYDAILVAGGVAVQPDALLSQLADKGRLAAIWLDAAASWCRLWMRSEAVISSRRLFDAPAHLLPGFDSASEFSF